MPLLAKASASSVRLHNPEFEYLLFDDARMEEVVNDCFPEYRTVFRSFRLPIQRYDFFRYLAVYQFGGFYFDMDIFLASDLDGLLDSTCVFPFERLTWTEVLRDRHGMDWEIGNYAFAASPGHPFLRAVIENCARAQHDTEWRDSITQGMPSILRKELAVIYTTGPGMVTRTLAEFSGSRNTVNVLFPENVCDRKYWNLFGDYGVHLGQGNWRATHGNWRRRLVAFLQKRNENRAIKQAEKIGRRRSLEQLK